jgi:hypothetical protein
MRARASLLPPETTSREAVDHTKGTTMNHRTTRREPSTVRATYAAAGHSREVSRRLERRALAALGINPLHAPRQVTYTWLRTQRSLDEIGDALLKALDIEAERAELYAGREAVAA